MRRLQRGVVVALLGLSACWNFDNAYSQFCDGGRCGNVAVKDGGMGGGGADSGSTEDGGARTDAGSGSADSGTPVDAGSGSADSGTTVDAGPVACRGWGQACTGGDCCPLSDAGVLQACSRNNLCQEYAADCKESGFDCAGDHDCCGENCVAGRCAICKSQGSSCVKATDCCPGYSCAADQHCVRASTLLPDGARCQSSGQCSNGFCDPADAGPHNGLCTMPVTCARLGSVNTANCCPGLVGDGGSNCCQPDNDWCEYSADCCSNNCTGRRCTRDTSTGIGDRCWSDSQCAGLLSTCNPVGLTCSDRICLPEGLNAFTGCCTIEFNSSCRFSDGSTCLLGNATSASASNCCSGQLSNGKCTIVNFY